MFTPQTELSIDGENISINGRASYQGTSAEGLLFNVRTVNAAFDDTLAKVDWWDDDGSHDENAGAGYGKWASPASAEDNTKRFIASLSDYKAHGILAVNLNFQGGHPLMGKADIAEGRGSAGARPNGHRDFYHNSGFTPDGSIDSAYGRRIANVIEACDRIGMIVILQLFYFGQDTVFKDETGILAAIDNAVDYVCERGYRNVIIEIANEVMAGHYHHDALKPDRVGELVLRARSRAMEAHGRALPVSTSEAAMLSPKQWTDEQIDSCFRDADVVLLHGGDNIETGKVGDTSEIVNKTYHIRGCDWFKARPRPIVFNESDGKQAFEAAVKRRISFGLHSNNQQTMWPPKWGVWEPEHMWFFERTKQLTET